MFLRVYVCLCVVVFAGFKCVAVVVVDCCVWYCCISFVFGLVVCCLCVYFISFYGLPVCFYLVVFGLVLRLPIVDEVCFRLFLLVMFIVCV